MAKNHSFIKLEGTIDNVTFYNKNGKNFVKAKSTLSKARIMNDAKFRRTRENMSEFGASATAAKSFRSAFAGTAKKMSDPYMSSRMTGIMKRIVNNGAGFRGERDITISDHLELIRGFEFNIHDSFNSHFVHVVDLPEISVDRNSVSWTLPAFNPDDVVVAPEGATHFKMVFTAGYVSNYAYNFTDEKYEALEGKLDGTSGTVYSAALPLHTPVATAITLDVVLQTGATIPSDISVFAGVGIVFYQEINGQLYEFAQGNTMKVAVVG